MSTLTVKNTRAKVSPGGVITLPVSARKTLGMKPKAGARVTVSVKGNTVLLAPATADGGFRVSPRGQMEVRGEALRVLEGGKERHFYFELDDERQTVALHPWK
ncbi:AbrB/MazE/SpoVT family DNA-binding domain-containing protein [Paeniglutamicibacter kerguelensis]|uniref:Bifunctional DNA-binding transcriptional regulator/antitoxin component of YhaV-PrlF toxin-antitoxin module n=1 Tax=Paeniglutamicibacter kerguelensis TaxID=254788 RepID=A0ABS4XBD8_9MICC|nr:AbrB/MazE/SpoVT family DNA-binding domain-containing protein [Paeniglutamicibacter kerguelensis]MBP2385785.1 bifunctional DNA-binding transcriptional regulator/antitoxin component of YhaV-PrlF toxin-antitoxin module [Paeniglutamicibacter kerguelensis]